MAMIDPASADTYRSWALNMRKAFGDQFLVDLANRVGPHLRRLLGAEPQLDVGVGEAVGHEARELLAAQDEPAQGRGQPLTAEDFQSDGVTLFRHTHSPT